MRISPPLAVVSTLVVLVAATALFAPPSPAQTNVSVPLSADAYRKLDLWGETHVGTNGRARSVPQVIEMLADRL
jgi:hypothetical protein